MSIAKKLKVESKIAELEEKLKEMMGELSMALAKDGHMRLPEKEEAWVLFREFSLEKALAKFSQFQTYYNIYMNAFAQKNKSSSSSQLIWYAIKELNLRPANDFFDTIGNDDIVEFYNSEGVQVFHNVNFLEVCSYTWAELLNYDTFDLWARDEKIVQLLLQAGGNCFAGNLLHTIDADVPEHLLEEKFSEDHYIVRLNIRKFSPLFDKSGRATALAVVAKAELVPEKDMAKYSKSGIPRPKRVMAKLHSIVRKRK